jgi:glycosyltransferase involved in cell wall biosynthesis
MKPESPLDPVQTSGANAQGDAGEWPSVSVVVPTHNRPQLLAKTVHSILNQRYPGPLEVLVVFDRQDPVPPDVEVPEGRRLLLLGNDRTPGPAGAYNVGALAGTGTYFALCDDDDEWLPDKLRLQVELMTSHPEALFGTCGIYLGDGRTLTRNPARVPDKELLSMEDLLRSPRNELHSSTFIVRRERMLSEVGLVDEEIPGSYGEDYDWLLRAARVSPVLAVRQPLVRVRWQYSYFADRWPTIVEAITYQLARRPELQDQPGNLARLYGRLAFAHAAMGHRQEAYRWARMSRKLNWRQPRVYLAYLVTSGLVKPRAVMRLAHSVGRGI